MQHLRLRFLAKRERVSGNKRGAINSKGGAKVLVVPSLVPLLVLLPLWGRTRSLSCSFLPLSRPLCRPKWQFWQSGDISQNAALEPVSRHKLLHKSKCQCQECLKLCITSSFRVNILLQRKTDITRRCLCATASWSSCSGGSMPRARRMSSSKYKLWVL